MKCGNHKIEVSSIRKKTATQFWKLLYHLLSKMKQKRLMRVEGKNLQNTKVDITDHVTYQLSEYIIHTSIFFKLTQLEG